MDDSPTECRELFSQDGVLLKQATAAYLSFINSIGTFYLTESTNDATEQFIEWRPNEVTIVDTDVQEQEWTVVNTIHKQNKSPNSNLPLDSYNNRVKCLRYNLSQIKSFRVQKYRQLWFYDGKSEVLCKFLFQHGDCEVLVNVLKNMLKTTQSKRDRNLFIAMDPSNLELQRLDTSFAALELNNEGNSLWKLVKNFREQPVETTFEAFAKVTDYVYRYPDQQVDGFAKEDLTKSITTLESTLNNQFQNDYEVISNVSKLPAIRSFPRLEPLSVERWKSEFDLQGVIQDEEAIKQCIFRGGISAPLRCEVWKYLLDYFPWKSTQKEREVLIQQKRDEYYAMKLQWKTITKTQEENFSDYRDRKSLIEKDVNRTDRNIDFFAGDNNVNLQTLNDILMTYVMYNFDLGYVQGMSDLLSPILQLIGDESDAFWCFVGFMNKVRTNFDKNQADMMEQLVSLHKLLAFIDPEFASYLDQHESGNMYFCFRWLLIWFKRELSFDDVMTLWEVLWTDYPCKNFLLLVSVAILEQERDTIIGNNFGFTEILKHINELAGTLDLNTILDKAEGTYNQIKEAPHTTDTVKMILGLPVPRKRVQSYSLDESVSNSCNQATTSSEETRNSSPEENVYETSLNLSYT